MEVLQASCDSIYDLVPLSPIELFAFLSVYVPFIISESMVVSVCEGNKHCRKNVGHN